MAETPRNPTSLIGRAVRDKYGRLVGRIISVISAPNGDAESLLIKEQSGRFIRCQISQLKADGECVILTPMAVVKALEIRERMPLLWRKAEMLSKLYEERRIPPKAFDELQGEVNEALKQLAHEARAVAAELEQACSNCSQQMRDLITAMACLEVERGMGRVREDVYREAMMEMRRGLRQVVMEKADLEALRNELAEFPRKMAEAAKAEARRQAQLAIPAGAKPLSHPIEAEKPVVVHLRDAAEGVDSSSEVEAVHG